ncbi:MAG: lysylphosphatidylglycerol synthase transmembrane domain-containing protein [Actinomycetota bacterium]|nr:lysylphosphatidylglycerol synthase transmembrane domain-containing protein [Actinomycetota bacterium]
MPREIRIILSVGSLVFVFEYLVLPQFASARHSLHLLALLNPVLVVLAVLFEMAAIYAYVELTRAVLYPHAPSRFNILRVNLAGLAIGHVVPGGAAPSGALAYRIFSELDVPKDTSAFGLAAQGAGSAVVLNILFWIALVISIPLNGINPGYGFAALAGVFLLLAFFGTVFLITRGQRRADAWLRVAARHLPALNPDKISQLLVKVADRINLLIGSRRTLWTAFTWASLNWLLDAACLWVFIWAFGTVISPVDLLVAYGLANVLAAIPVTPAGLGVVEGVLIPTLVGFGVPHSQAILAVLAYRLVNFWIPIPIGGAAYASLQFRRGPIKGAGSANGSAASPDA